MSPCSEESGAGEARISALVVSWNTKNLLDLCVGSLLRTLPQTSEILVVDNASSDGSASHIEARFGSDSRLRLIRNETNVGFARANNQAVKASTGNVLAIVNPDIEVEGPVLPRMAQHLCTHPAAGIVTCRLIGPRGETQTLHRSFPTLRVLFFTRTAWGSRLDRRLLRRRYHQRHWLRDLPTRGVVRLDQAAGACFLVSRALVESLGGLFDERFPIIGNDLDLSRRVADAGFEVHLLQDETVRHFGGASLRQVDIERRDLWFWVAMRRYYEIHEPPWKRSLVRLMTPARVRAKEIDDLLPAPEGAPP